MRKYQKGNSAPTFSNSISSVSFDIYCRRIHGIEIPILFSPNFNSETWLLTYHWENRQETSIDRIEKIDLHCCLKPPRRPKLSIYFKIEIEPNFIVLYYYKSCNFRANAYQLIIWANLRPYIWVALWIKRCNVAKE